MSSPPIGPSSGNQLLDALGPRGKDRLLAQALEGSKVTGDVLYEPGHPISWVYFPVTAVVSILTVLRDGSAVETATIGREGVVGTFVFLGDDRSPNARAVVQMPGGVIRVDVGTFLHEMERDRRLRTLVHEYTRALLVQVAQSVACAAAHPVRERLARWLLQTSDRVTSDEVSLTHEFLAHVLHVRRASVTGALRELQGLGLVRTSRGRTTIVDRAALAEAACECYAMIRDEYARLLPGERRLVPTMVHAADETT
jgi:CRP-like cAMP-binding protein